VQQPHEAYAMQAARAAYGLGRPQSWGDALALLKRAAEAGDDGAERQLELVTQAPIEDLLRLPRVEQLSTVAAIGACRGFAPPGFSEWLIERAAGRLAPAAMNAAHAPAVRTATSAPFGAENRDVVLAIMQERAARLTGVPLEYHEPPNVIRYEPGQEFTLHTDFVDPRVPAFAEELRVLGQRTTTIVTYLNDDFDGAETIFPDAQVKFRGGTGDAIVFSNVRRDGSPDYNTRHAGLPPTRGRKWVLSQWMRSNPVAG
jgi:prolyl 4-hydroxylase